MTPPDAKRPAQATPVVPQDLTRDGSAAGSLLRGCRRLDDILIDVLLDLLAVTR